jgi:hypothetical protein
VTGSWASPIKQLTYRWGLEFRASWSDVALAVVTEMVEAMSIQELRHLTAVPLMMARLRRE